jgi:hypothetical protein
MLKLVDNLAKGNVSDVVCFYVAATVWNENENTKKRKYVYR